MRRLIIFGSLLCLIITATSAFAVDKLDRLLVYGDSFIFGVKEPAGWKADTSNASQIQANILFYKAGETFANASSLIYIRINNGSLSRLQNQRASFLTNFQKKILQIFVPASPFDDS